MSSNHPVYNDWCMLLFYLVINHRGEHADVDIMIHRACTNHRGEQADVDVMIHRACTNHRGEHADVDAETRSIVSVRHMHLPSFAAGM
jgi:hypothetical protein